MVKTLRFHWGVGLIPGQGTKVPYAMRCGKKNCFSYFPCCFRFDPGLFRNVFYFPLLVDFPDTFLLMISNLITLWQRIYSGVISILLIKFVEICFMAKNIGYIGKCPHALEKYSAFGTCLVVQWLGIHLPMQDWTRVQSLVWEDPTCCGATKSVHHNY